MPEEETRSESESTESPKGVRQAALYLLNNKESGFLWITRMATILFSVFYLIPIFGGTPYGYYCKALIASIVTSVIRLSQRMPRFEFSKTYLALLLVEDSCHYIMFAIIYYTYPMTLVLLPLSLFAFLHSASFTVKMLQICGWTNSFLTVALSRVIQTHSKGIFRLIAYTEIFLMPLNIFMLFVGKGSLLTPIVYYRFLTLRYQSRRNPYTRSVFYELRLAIESMANQPVVPAFLRRLCHKFIELVSRMAPFVPTT